MLSLIAKHKLNIRDIEISILLEQFLAYIEAAGEQDIELAGEFLEAAAHLIYIKTVALLPKHEAEKLKRELEGALIEYALCKLTAERMREIFIGDLVFTRKPLTLEVDMTYTLGHHPAELVEALSVISDRGKLQELLRQAPSKVDINPTVVAEYVSVVSKVFYVLRKLRKLERIKVKSLFSGLERSAQVAMFMALLELVSHSTITFSEDLDYIKIGESKTRATPQDGLDPSEGLLDEGGKQNS
jgi:segregation and condensation protein A